MTAGRRELVVIDAGGCMVEGLLALPPDPCAMVLFAHGSGSSRASPRNHFVADQLRQAGLGTLLMDLLCAAEDHDTARRFDIDLLTTRLALASDWLAAHPLARNLPLGVFGASTGAAGALRLAASRPDRVRALVSRGGRPDLAGRAALANVRSPTLLIVGALDTQVIELNRAAADLLSCPHRIELVAGATHLFEESGCLHTVAQLAERWFKAHLVAGPC